MKLKNKTIFLNLSSTAFCTRTIFCVLLLFLNTTLLFSQEIFIHDQTIIVGLENIQTSKLVISKQENTKIYVSNTTLIQGILFLTGEIVSTNFTKKEIIVKKETKIKLEKIKIKQSLVQNFSKKNSKKIIPYPIKSEFPFYKNNYLVNGTPTALKITKFKNANSQVEIPEIIEFTIEYQTIAHLNYAFFQTLESKKRLFGRPPPGILG